MAQSCCPVRDCTNPLPEDGFICADHHLKIPRKNYALIIRMRFDAQRTSDPEKKRYFNQRFNEYLTSAANKIAASANNGANNG